MAIQQFPAASGGPSGGETVWTVVSNGTFNNTFSTLTFSGLSGYKKYNLIINRLNTTNSSRMFIRINGDSSASYTYNAEGYNNASYEVNFYDNTTAIRPIGGNQYTLSYGSIMFNNADITGQKTINVDYYSRNASSIPFHFTFLAPNPTSNTSPITSITIFDDNANNFNSGGYTLLGGN